MISASRAILIMRQSLKRWQKLKRRNWFIVPSIKRDIRILVFFARGIKFGTGYQMKTRKLKKKFFDPTNQTHLNYKTDINYFH